MNTSDTPFPSNVTESGHGWRLDVGISILAFEMLGMVLALLAVHLTHHRQPLASRSKVLLCIMCLASIPYSFPTQLEVIGVQNVPCRVYYWIVAPAPSFLIGVWLLGNFRLVRMFGLEALKREYQQGKVNLTTKQADTLKAYRFWHTDKALLTIFAVHLVFMYACFFAVFWSDHYYNSDNKGCRIRPPPWFKVDDRSDVPEYVDGNELAWMVMVVVYLPPALYFTYKLWLSRMNGVTESLGLMTECIVHTLALLCTFLMFLCVDWSDYSESDRPYNFLYINETQGAFYVWVLVVIPVSWTSSRGIAIRRWVRRYLFCRDISVQPLRGTLEDLQAMLHTRNGMLYMICQCNSEFCEETLHCLRAIWRYKSNPSLPAAIQLFNTFVEQGAPLQVNVSNVSLRTISQRVAELQVYMFEQPKKGSSVFVFDDLEEELTTLLYNNSYRRFLQSGLYLSYIAGQPPPTDNEVTITPSHHIHSRTTLSTVTVAA